MPKIGVVSGTVETVAARVRANAATIGSGHRGRAMASQVSVKRPNTTRPVTAATESWNPRSKAVAGIRRIIAAAAPARVAEPSDLLPLTPAADTAKAMTHARSADAWTPEKATYAPVRTAMAIVLGTRGTCRADNTAPNRAATTTKWLPETATRWVRPVVLKSVSAAVPPSRRRSPRTTPSRSAPPSPEIAAICREHQTRRGPIAPRALFAQPFPRTLFAFSVPQIPALRARAA